MGEEQVIVSRPGRGADDPRRFAERPLLWIVSLGGSTGEVMKVHLVNPGPDPIEIDGNFTLAGLQGARER